MSKVYIYTYVKGSRPSPHPRGHKYIGLALTYLLSMSIGARTHSSPYDTNQAWDPSVLAAGLEGSATEAAVVLEAVGIKACQGVGHLAAQQIVADVEIL